MKNLRTCCLIIYNEDNTTQKYFDSTFRNSSICSDSKEKILSTLHGRKGYVYSGWLGSYTLHLFNVGAYTTNYDANIIDSTGECRIIDDIDLFMNKISKYPTFERYDSEARNAELELEIERLKAVIKIKDEYIDELVKRENDNSNYSIFRLKTANKNHLIRFFHNHLPNFNAYFDRKGQLLKIVDDNEWGWAVENWGRVVKDGLPKTFSKKNNND